MGWTMRSKGRDPLERSMELWITEDNLQAQPSGHIEKREILTQWYLGETG